MELFLAKMKITITDRLTDVSYVYYQPELQCTEFVDFVEKVRIEKGLEYDNMHILIENIDKTIAYFD